MKARTRQALALGLGLSLTAGLVLLMLLGNRLEGERPESLLVSEVQVSRPPPPPPPPPPAGRDSAESGEPALDLELSAAEAPVALFARRSDIQVPAGGLGDFSGAGLGELAAMVQPTFELSELDAIPIVVYDPPNSYPRSLQNRGIESFQLILHIEIDQQGNARLVRVMETDYPEVNDYMADYVSRVKFTPPTVSGIPVKSQFRWPVVMNLCRTNC